MPYPLNPAHRLLLEDGTSYLLLEDNSSKLILDEQIALDDPLNAGTVSSVTPGLTFAGQNITYTEPVVVQRATGADNNGGSGSVSAAFSGNNTPGNAIIVIETLALTAITGSTAISDTNGNTYGSNIYNFSDGTNFVSVAVWIAYNIKGGANTVTINPDAGAVNLHVYEVSKLATSSALDQTAHQVQSSTASLSSGSITTTTPNQLLIGIFMDDVNDTFTPTGNWINKTQQANTGFSSATAEQIVSGTGTFSATARAGSSATTSLTAILSFKGSPSTLPNLTYEVQVDTVNTFDSQVGVSTIDSSSGASFTTAGIFMNNTNTIGVGTAFTGNGSTLGSASLKLNNNSGSPTGFIQYKIYALTGTFGTNAKPTGAALATSGTLDVSTLTSTLTHTQLNFTGGNQITLANGTQYFLTVEIATVGTNFVLVEIDTGGTGNYATDTGGVWTGTTPMAPFIIKTPATTSPLLDKTSDVDTGFVDDTTTTLGEDRLLLEDGISYLLLEDNASKLAINYDYPSQDFITYTVPAATLSNGVTYYWRVRQKVQNGGSYTSWSEIRSFTVSAGGATSASITQLAATLTFSGGTQAASAAVDATIAQSAATLTFSGGTQSIATVNKVALSQVAATLTFTGGTQAIATSNFVSVAQLAGTITFAGGTQTIVTTQSSSVSQLAATVTFTGGTQAVQSNAIISQSAATLTFSGGTQAIATIRNVAVSQLAGTVTFSGGTQAIATVNDVAVSQVAGTLTFSGGTQVVASIQDVAIAQTHATLTFAGGTQAIAAIRNASLVQIAGVITFTGGTQAAAGLTNASVVQTAASLTFTGGTQTTAIQVGAAIAQVAATITFMGGVPAVIFNPPPQFGSFGTIISTTDQLGTLSDIASTNIAGGDIVGIIADSLASASQAGEDASLSIDDSTQNTTLQG